MTIKPWGCHSRPRADGYWASDYTFTDGKERRIQQAIWIKDTGSLDCKYRQHTPNDPRCEGCTSP
jgi:hypothetical protein